ncbi:hypothetical protein R1flu_014542 [Riccia fluitans]|uniref:Uncharacterized protein n=1 Tax=Riccia fluitans TaxID=41844 RepID=A0ABD1YGS8_9MARC
MADQGTVPLSGGRPARRSRYDGYVGSDSLTSPSELVPDQTTARPLGISHKAGLGGRSPAHPMPMWQPVVVAECRASWSN